MAIDKRKLWIGVISSLLVIILRLMVGIYNYEVAIDKTIDPVRQLIFVIAQSYLYISILFLLKNVLIDYYQQEFLRTNLVWIIKLNAILAALAILIALGFGRYLAVILVIVGIVTLIFYIRIFSDIMLIDGHIVPSIYQLHKFFKALLITLLMAAVLSVAMKYGGKPQLEFINQLFLAIPFIFVGTFFYKTMKAIDGCNIPDQRKKGN
jgi:hypothetical protein